VTKAGPDNPWRDDDAANGQAWTDAGFTAEQARVFRRWRFAVHEAVAWRHAGVADGIRAAQWVTAGVTPESVNRWRAAGIDATQAVHWHEMGFDLQSAREALQRGQTPDSAFAQRRQSQWPGPLSGARPGPPGPVGAHADLLRKMQGAGVPPQVLRGYLAANWDADEALPWALAGLDATDATMWRVLRLTAAEASRLARKGASPADTIRDWWRAGIPFDEVADWIGAGLSATEAADQRARGITAEQAAALRALRDQETDD
jgi:hypothetical protein